MSDQALMAHKLRTGRAGQDFVLGKTSLGDTH